MDHSISTVPGSAHLYRPPSLLRDIRLLDLLELSGTTAEVSRLLRLSQPTVSRRTRRLATDFALVPHRRRLAGGRYSSNPALRLVRLGCRAHRLMAGVARLGADVLLQPVLMGCGWLLPAPPRFRVVERWLELVRQGVLDGALLSGLEFEGDGAPRAPEIELVRLGDLPLDLAIDPAVASRRGSDVASVLAPGRALAPGLRHALEERGLPLKTVGHACQTPAHWLGRLASSGLAMPLLDLPPAAWWEPLHRQSLADPPRLPIWLALPAGWQEQAVLAHTARSLRLRVDASPLDRGPGAESSAAGASRSRRMAAGSRTTRFARPWSGRRGSR
jgi:hypothetical protein